MNTSWKTEYDEMVATIVAGRREINLEELCDRLGLMRDQVEAIADRLVARGVIERDQRQPDAFTA